MLREGLSLLPVQWVYANFRLRLHGHLIPLPSSHLQTHKVDTGNLGGKWQSLRETLSGLRIHQKPWNSASKPIPFSFACCAQASA